MIALWVGRKVKLLVCVDQSIDHFNGVLVMHIVITSAMYKKVFSMKAALKVHWHGNLDQVLLPLDLEFFDDISYRASLTKAETMKELYEAIREGTDEMFDILSLEYTFFNPWMGG